MQLSWGGKLIFPLPCWKTPAPYHWYGNLRQDQQEEGDPSFYRTWSGKFDQSQQYMKPAQPGHSHCCCNLQINSGTTHIQQHTDPGYKTPPRTSDTPEVTPIEGGSVGLQLRAARTQRDQRGRGWGSTISSSLLRNFRYRSVPLAVEYFRPFLQ